MRVSQSAVRVSTVITTLSPRQERETPRYPQVSSDTLGSRCKPGTRYARLSTRSRSRRALARCPRAAARVVASSSPSTPPTTGRFSLGSTKKITTPPRALTPSSALIPRRSDAAARFGVDHLVRANDSCSFACVYRKAPRFPPEHDDSVSPHSLTSGALVSAAESEDPDLFRDPWARPVQVSRPSKARYRPSPPPHPSNQPTAHTHPPVPYPTTNAVREGPPATSTIRADGSRALR